VPDCATLKPGLGCRAERPWVVKPLPAECLSNHLNGAPYPTACMTHSIPFQSLSNEDVAHVGPMVQIADGSCKQVSKYGQLRIAPCFRDLKSLQGLATALPMPAKTFICLQASRRSATM